MKKTTTPPWDKDKFTVFAAFPWKPSRKKYEEVFRVLKKEHKDIKLRYGMKVYSNDNVSSTIEEFLYRNKQMYEIFVKGIERSDIFIADITGQNPNVMLELGIAMQLNKNILILTSDKTNKYPFDIQSVRIETYSSKEKLVEHIDTFIKLFKKIITQTYDDYIDCLHFKLEKEITLCERQNKTIDVGRMRNLRLKFDYQFLDHVHTADWVGIYLRTLGPETKNSELIYTRVNGQLESLTMPHLRETQQGREVDKKLTQDKQIMEVEIIENKILARTNSKKLIDDNVAIEGFGEIIIGSCHHPKYPSALKGHNLRIIVSNLEVICLDATTPIY